MHCSEKKGQFIAFYQTNEDEVPFLVLPILNPQQEALNRTRYRIDERFAPERFRKDHMPKADGWAFIREQCKAKFFTTAAKKQAALAEEAELQEETPRSTGIN